MQALPVLCVFKRACPGHVVGCLLGELMRAQFSFVATVVLFSFTLRKSPEFRHEFQVCLLLFSHQVYLHSSPNFLLLTLVTLSDKLCLSIAYIVTFQMWIPLLICAIMNRCQNFPSVLFILPTNYFKREWLAIVLVWGRSGKSAEGHECNHIVRTYIYAFPTQSKRTENVVNRF